MRLRSARTVSTLRSPRGPRLMVFPLPSRIDVTRPRPSRLAFVPRLVITVLVRPSLSRSTTVPCARVLREYPPFAPEPRPLPEILSEAVFSPPFAVLPGWPAGLLAGLPAGPFSIPFWGLFDGPRRPGRSVGFTSAVLPSEGVPGRTGTFVLVPPRPGRP